MKVHEYIHCLILLQLVGFVLRYVRYVNKDVADLRQPHSEGKPCYVVQVCTIPGTWPLQPTMVSGRLGASEQFWDSPHVLSKPLSLLLISGTSSVTLATFTRMNWDAPRM